MSALLIAWFLLSVVSAQPLRIGLQNPPGSNTLQMYGPTLQDLQTKVGVQIELVSFVYDADLQQAAVNGSLQGVLAGPGLAYCVMLATDIQPVASVVTYLDGEPVNQVGGVIVVRQDSAIQRVEDLRGMVVAAGQLTQLATCQAQWGLLQQNNVSLFADTKGVFLYSDLDALLQSVRDGVVDAGFMRAGFLEESGYNASSFRVVNPTTFQGFPYNSSTPLYSNTALVALPSTNYALRTNISRALLDYGPGDPPLVAGMYAGWAPEQSFIRIRSLQAAIGILSPEGDRCNEIVQVYDGVDCPAGQQRKSAAQLVTSCQEAGVMCPGGGSTVQCVCSPCEPIVYPKRIGGLSPARFAGILVAVFLVVVAVGYIVWRRLRLRVQAILWDDLHVDGSCVLGKASNGLVLKGKYQGSAVAVKRAYPRMAPGHSIFDMDDTEIEKLLGPGLAAAQKATAVKRWMHTMRQVVECFGAVTKRKRQIHDVHARSHARMRHSNIVPTLGVCLGEDRNEILAVNLYMERGSLHDLLNNPSVVIDTILTTSIARDIASALEWCHLQSPPVVGCNMQPHHILMDINLRAHLANSVSRMSRESVFMAPELLQGGGATPASDAYAFGMLMYTLLFRHEPFEGQDRGEVIRAIRDSHSVVPRRPDVSEAEEPMRRMLAQCWDNDPAARPTLSEICTRLQSANRKSLADDLISKVRQGQALLESVYPPNVARALEEGRMPEPETHPFVTIFFSDIMGFTRISSNLGAEGVMAMLHTIYTAMDKLAEKHGVFKVETIGDAVSPPLQARCVILSPMC